MMRPAFFPLAERDSRILVGLMSGTSVDGIDAAAVRVKGRGEAVTAEPLAFFTTPYTPAVRARILEACRSDRTPVCLLGPLHMELGEVYARAALEVIRLAGLSPGQVDAIGSHGQTVWHRPVSEDGRAAFTVQLGDGNVIAQRTGIPCVSDFRTADLAAGGQGAPLVPFTEYLLYRSQNEGVLLQNIGGIGNVTVLAAGCRAQDVTAFDTGPGNMVIDGLMERLTRGRQRMDESGRVAACGRVCEPLLQKLMQHPYFKQPAPKTTGREMFGRAYVEALEAQGRAMGLTDADMVATATMLTARSIAQAVQDFILPRMQPARMVVGGGGSHNGTLLAMLAQALEPMGVRVYTQEQLGASSDAKEAVAFALLADCTLRGVPAAVPSATGARYSAVLGKLSFPGGLVYNEAASCDG